MNNKILVLGATVLLGTSLVSCGSREKELVIWARNKNVDAINYAIESYKEEVDSNFKARVESFARNDIDKKFKTASQNGNYNSIGDIVLCDSSNLLSYYASWSNIFTDLSDYVTKEEKDTLVQSTLTAPSVDGKFIGLPVDVPPNVVFANKKLWKEETINKILKDGWTWEDYISIGKDIKNAHGNDVFMTSYNLRGDDRIYRVLSSQKGEWFMDKDHNVQVGNKTSVTAMTKVKTMKDENVLGHIDTGDYKSLMKNNKIAAQIQGFFLGGQLKDIAPEMSGEWVILPLPKWDINDASSASITGGSYLYANSKLKGKDKDSAIGFMKWMTLNKETSIQSLKKAGVFPALATAYETDYFKNTKDPYFDDKNVWNNVAEWSIDAKPIIATKYFGYNYDTFMKSQEKILFSNEDVNIGEELKKCGALMKNNAK